MATQTITSIELEPLDGGSTELNSQVPASVLSISANATSDRPDLIVGSNTNSSKPILPRGRSVIVIAQLAGINFITSFSNGLVTVSLPAISTALSLRRSLLLWPMNSYSLTTAACLLIAGAVADVIGSRNTNLSGCFLIALFILVSGFSQTGIQLILFRAMQGIGGALALPSSISIISKSISSGKPRNIGFACLGLAQPLGFSFGMVLAGAFIELSGWRTGFFLGGGVSFFLFIVGIWALPKDGHARNESMLLRRLATEVDWIGAGLASTAIALFSYVLAMLAADMENIKDASIIVLLSLSVALVASFVIFMRRQEHTEKPALIPNTIWQNASFTTVCLLVLLSNAVVNCMELFSSLFFQEVQGDTALETSLKILPNMILGIVTNFTTGFFINRMLPIHAILITSGLCAIAPALMATIDPSWPYWYDAFFAQVSYDTFFICPQYISD